MCPEVSKQDLADAQAGKDDDEKDQAAYVACGSRLTKEAATSRPSTRRRMPMTSRTCASPWATTPSISTASPMEPSRQS